MKKITFALIVLMFTLTLWIVSCSTPVHLASWKNPQEKTRISKIIVMALFDKLTYIQPCEEQLAAWFNSQNLTTIKSLEILTPFKKYSSIELQKKFDSVGSDGLLLVSYKGTDVSIDLNSGYYGGYGGWWGGFGGSWSSTSTVSLRATLYATKTDVVLWTGDLSLTDPGNVTNESQQVARIIFADWLKNELLKNPPPPPQKK